MKKKLTIILSAVALLAVVSIAVFHFIPSSANADDSSAVVMMTKLVRDEGAVGQFELSLENMKVEHVDGNDYLYLHIDNFDGMTNIFPASDGITKDCGKIFTFEGIECRYAFCRADDGKDGISHQPTLKFDANFDRWALTDGPNVVYVGSVSGNYTVEELIEFFRCENFLK